MSHQMINHNIIKIQGMRIFSGRYMFSAYKAVSLNFQTETKCASIKLINPKKRNVLSHATIK